MPGTIDLDELVAVLQRSGRGGGGDNGRARGGGSARANGGGRGQGQGGGGRGRAADGRGSRPDRGRGQGGVQRPRGERNAGDADHLGVRDWHCGGCGVANRHWRQRCFGCDGRREVIEEQSLQQRTAAARLPASGRAPPPAPASSAGRSLGATYQATAQPAAGARGGPSGAAAAAKALPQRQSLAENRQASGTVGGRSYLAAATPREASLRPGGGATGPAPLGSSQLHANSPGEPGKSATPAGARGGAEGGQHQGGLAGGGAPRARTVSWAEARKGAADADGFVRVQPPTKFRDVQDGAACGSGDVPQDAAEGVTDGDQGMGREEWGDWADDGTSQVAEGDEPTEEDLRGFWEAAKEVLAYAKRQGYPPEHPVRRNAQQQVEESLAQWQAVRPPRAIPTRMGWAEEALQRAKRAQARAEQDLEELDRQYEANREEKLRVLQEARERTKTRERNLADLSREAAQEYRGGMDEGDDNAKVLRGTFETLDTEVGPALEAALEKTCHGTEQHAALQRALQAVLVIHGALGVAAGGAAVDYFDMSQHDGDDTATPCGAACDGAGDSAMDTTEARPPRWLEQQDNKRGGADGTAAAFGSPPPRWKKNRTAGGEGGAPATGTAAATPTGGGGANASAADGAGHDGEFAARRAQIIAQATSEGADAPTEYLQQLAPEALEEWAKENLV